MTAAIQRMCKGCGTPLRRRGDEKAPAFAQRQYCSPACTPQRRRGRGDHTPAKPVALHAADLSWHNRAACKGMDTELFFHPDRERGPARAQRVARARSVCVGCPVRYPCARHSLIWPEKYGIWGGLSEGDREGAKSPPRAGPARA